MPGGLLHALFVAVEGSSLGKPVVPCHPVGGILTLQAKHLIADDVAVIVDAVGGNVDVFAPVLPLSSVVHDTDTLCVVQTNPFEPHFECLMPLVFTGQEIAKVPGWRERAPYQATFNVLVSCLPLPLQHLVPYLPGGDSCQPPAVKFMGDGVPVGLLLSCIVDGLAAIADTATLTY